MERTLRVRPDAVREARHAVVTMALPETTRQTVALLASELVTNSIRHAGLSEADSVDMRVANGDQTVRLAVHDGGDGFTPPAPHADPLTVGGQGFVIVAALSDTWGVDSDADGCTVWCELAVEEAPAVAAAPEMNMAYA
jgi:two-component sensor histidine kinase